MYPASLIRTILSYAIYPVLITMFRGDMMRRLVQEEILSLHYEVMILRKDFYPVLDTKEGVYLTRWFGRCALSSENQVQCFDGPKFSGVVPETCYYWPDKIIYLSEGQVHLRRTYNDTIIASKVSLLSVHKHNPVLLTRENEVVVYENERVKFRHRFPLDTYISLEITHFGPCYYIALLNNKRCLNVYQLLDSEVTLVRMIEDVDVIASHNGIFGYFRDKKVVIWTMDGERSYDAPHLVSFLHTKMLLDIHPFQVRLFPLSEVIAYHTQKKEYVFIELFYQ